MSRWQTRIPRGGLPGTALNVQLRRGRGSRTDVLIEKTTSRRPVPGWQQHGSGPVCYPPPNVRTTMAPSAIGGEMLSFYWPKTLINVKFPELVLAKSADAVA